MNISYIAVKTWNLVLFISGMFRHVIMQSGSTLAHWAVTRSNNSPDIYFKAFTSEMGCLSNSTLHIKNCLQRVDGDRIQDLVFTGFGVSCYYHLYY